MRAMIVMTSVLLLAVGTVAGQSEIAKLTASDAAAGAEFGTSVGISGNVAVVGAQSNAAYIFARYASGTSSWSSWTEVTKLTALGASGFGSAVAISGDVVVVGAPLTNGATGAAFVFSRNEGGADNWGQVATLTASDGANLDRFGDSVGIDGDVIVIGAWQNDAAAEQAGSAYVFARNQGGLDNWGEVAILTASDPQEQGRFGFSVAVCGDVAIVGAIDDSGSDPEPNGGAAYVFTRNQGGADNWSEVKKLSASDAQPSDRFGHSVAIDNDLAIVGARFASSGSGSAYLFGRNEGGADNWGELKELPGSGDFGYAVALNNDFAVVGAWEYDVPGLIKPGGTFVFDRNGTGADTWLEIAGLFAEDADDNDRFGCAVAITGDIAIIGCIRDDDGGSDSGSAYVYELRGTCPDLDGDGLVSITDLLALLAAWDACP